MSKARNIADLGSNDVLDTTASGVSVTGAIDASGNITSDSSTTPNFLLKVSGTEKGYIRNTSDITEINGVNGVSLRDSGTTVLTTDSTNGVEITSTGGQQLKLSRTGTGSQISSLVFNDASDNQNRFNSSNGNLEIEYGASNTNAMMIGNNGDIIMYKDDGSTTGFLFDASAGSVTLSGNLVLGNSGSINIPTVSSGNGNISFDGSNFNITSNSSSANMNFQTSSTTRMTLGVGGDLTTYPLAGQNATFNQDANDVDFTIRSSTNASLFRADGGNSNVGINISEPTAYGAHIRGQGREFTDTIWDPYNESLPGSSDRDVATLYVESTSAAAANYGASIGFRGKSGNTVDRVTYATIAGVKQNSTTDGSNSYSDQVQGCLDFYTSEGYSFSPNYGTRQKRRMRIDHYGRITKPYQPCFEVYQNGSDFAVSGNAKITCFQGERFDVGGVYNTSNQRFTAPVSGKYLFGMHLRMGAPGSVRVFRVEIRINGSSHTDLASIGGANNYDSGGGYDHPGCSGTTLLNLSANDYIELYTANELDSTNTLYIQNGYRSHWWGMLVS